MLTCEACKSENIQKLSLVYESGLSLVQGKQSGVGFGLGGDGGVVGIGSSKYKGTNQSFLSKNAAPPTRKNPFKVGLYYAVATCLIIQFAPGNLAIVLLLISGGCIHVYRHVNYNHRLYPNLFRKWDSSYLCLKCGAVSAPSHGQAALPSA